MGRKINLMMDCLGTHALETGTGTSNTAVTYKYAYDKTPVVVCTMLETGSGDNGYLQTTTTTGHTLTTTTAKTYNYWVVGPRTKARTSDGYRGAEDS